MARKIVHQLIDDLNGTLIEVGDGETVRFSFGGTAYEIDLTNENAAAFRAAFEPYVKAARSISSARSGNSTANGRRRRRPGQPDYSTIRAWASANDFKISERGRVPAAIIEAYEAAH